MPLREYQCQSCGHRFEIIQKMSDPPVETCPVCGGEVQKLQAAPAFHLKGTGWYVTDYAKKDSATAKTDGESAKPDDKAADDKKEKKEKETTAKPADTTASTPSSTDSSTTTKS